LRLTRIIRQLVVYFCERRGNITDKRDIRRELGGCWFEWFA
jgi:hypothetical protein